MITSKYVRGDTNHTKFVGKNNSSNSWKGLVVAEEVLKRGIQRKVYNGNEVLFWRDLRIGKKALIEIELKEILLSESYSRVKEY